MSRVASSRTIVATLALLAAAVACSTGPAATSTDDVESASTAACDQTTPISSVDASEEEPPNVSTRAIDGDLSTRWSAEGQGQFITADLGFVQSVCGVGIAWYKGDQRRSKFQVSTSIDGRTWTKALSKRSSGHTADFERYTFAKPEQARYVRITVNGNTDNDWASISELHVYGTPGRLADAGDATTDAMAAPRDVPTPLYGVTLDCGYPVGPNRLHQIDGADGLPGLAQLDGRIDDIVDSLRHLGAEPDDAERSIMPTTRVVFDKDVHATAYRGALQKLHPVTYVLGQLSDSSHQAEYTKHAWRSRVTDYLGTLGDLVDVWEVANEINGVASGTQYTQQDIADMVLEAYRQVKARGGKAMITLVHEDGQGCGMAPVATDGSIRGTDDTEMLVWADKYLPEDVKQGLDYVMVSYYEDDCDDWTPFFRRLSAMFPKAKVGFGEIGADDQLETYLNHYYRDDAGVRDVPSYVGGYFYWYYCTDMVPRASRPLWTTLDEAILANAKR